MMEYDKQQLKADFSEWENILNNTKLPLWDELPNLDLYMDQVIILINQYLGPICTTAPEEKAVTPPMINNYVKLKSIPAPIKKKYSRVHLAYLIMVCILKQTLSISTIKKLVPLELSSEEIREKYNTFAKNQQNVFKQITEQVGNSVDKVIKSDGNVFSQVDSFAMEIASEANILKILTEKMANARPDIKESKSTENK